MKKTHSHPHRGADRPVVDGQVACPSGVVVEVERCLLCPELEGLDVVDGVAHVHCRPGAGGRSGGAVLGAFGLEPPTR